MQKKTRGTFPIEVEPSAMQSLDEFCGQHDLKKKAVMSRLVEWFADSDDVVQMWVIGLLPEKLHQEAMRLMLEALGDPLAGEQGEGSSRRNLNDLVKRSLRDSGKTDQPRQRRKRKVS